MCVVWNEWKSVVDFYPLNTTQVLKLFKFYLKQTIETSLLSYDLPHCSDGPSYPQQLPCLGQPDAHWARQDDWHHQHPCNGAQGTSPSARQEGLHHCSPPREDSITGAAHLTTQPCPQRQVNWLAMNVVLLVITLSSARWKPPTIPQGLEAMLHPLHKQTSQR